MVKFKNLSEIEGFEIFDNYAICSDGKLMNIKKQTFLQGNTSGEHLKYTLTSCKYKKTIEAHKLVALAFVPGKFDGAVVDHIDSNSYNNNYTNLQWVTYSENSKKAIKPKYRKRFVIALNVKNNSKQLFNSVTECCNTIGISNASAYKVLNGYRKLVNNKTYKLYFVEQ